jgi:hypothetical protein
MSLRLAPVVLAVAMMVVEDIFGWAQSHRLRFNLLP